MQDPSIIFYLAMFTLGAAVVFGFWQANRARKAKIKGEESAFATHRRSPDSDN